MIENHAAPFAAQEAFGKMTERTGCSPLAPTHNHAFGSMAMSEAHSIELISEDAFGWYLAGLADGEGHFGLNKKTAGNGVGWQNVFEIFMRDDESKHIEAILRRMRCGEICRRPGRKPCRRMFPGERPEDVPVGNPQIGWVVRRIAELALVIVPHFDKYQLQLKKARDFSIWREAILLLYSFSLRPRAGKGGHSIEPEEHAKITSLMNRLKLTRKYDSSLATMPPIYVDPRPILPFAE